MTLSKRFTVWGIGLSKWLRLRPRAKGTATGPCSVRGSVRDSARQQRRSPISRPTAYQSSQFRALSLKLLLSYLGAMVLVIGLSAIAVYQFFAYSLSQELDQQLKIIAEAARHNLPAIQKNPTAANHRLPPEIDQDGDLDLAWQDLRQSPVMKSSEMVEWFDVNGQRLARAGNSLPLRPFVAQFQPLQLGDIRSLTIRIDTKQRAALQGYVRVSTPTGVMAADLQRLLIGLSVGGAIATLSIGGTGWWLTRRSLHPIEQNMEKLQQFTADASHELRSPITAMKIAVEAMQSHPDQVHPTHLRKLTIMAQATQQISRLVEDLLLLARADTQSSQPSNAAIKIPLHEILEDLVEFFEPRATAAGIQLQADLPCESWVYGDANQLQRVFANLLDNGIKYTPQGGRIQVTLAQQSAIAIVHVSDTGIGIATEQLPHVFDRFWRADESRSRPAGGTGLGLAIGQTIIEAHHGSITVKSQLGLGSCFQVTLPRLA